MVGRNVLHFEIKEKLGQGGMGVVYKALDTKLNRTVALKFLPSQLSSDEALKARFVQEAQAASALDHANICSIYEIGETEEGEVFIAMAYYDGQTLKYRLSEELFPIDRAIEVSRQLTKALECAHQAGIIHRDVKPANIMLTNRGDIKLLDFGLAKLMGGAELTMAGSTLGTAAYMSPEQARGGEVTTATDIWALGAVMYEVFAGAKPFAGEYDQALLYGILNEDPRPVSEVRPEVPEEISALVQRCLSKTASERPSPEEIISQLGGSSSSMSAVTSSVASSFPTSDSSIQPATPTSKRPVMIAVGIAALVLVAAVLWMALGKGGDETRSTRASNSSEAMAEVDRSVAVLPFKLRSATEEEASAVFAGGMHDDVLAQLAKISGLKVIARTSVMQYEGTTKTAREIASELNVASILEGTIQRSGDRVRINVSLIDGETESPLWSETYDEELTTENVFSIQSDLARSIAAALQTTLSPDEEIHLNDRVAIPMEAYELYTTAMFIFRSTSFGSRVQEAADLMLEALAIEPDYAQAQADLANIYLRGITNGMWSADDKADDIRIHIDKALAIDPELSTGHAALGSLELFYLNYEAAEIAFLKAISLAPGEAVAHRRYAQLLYRTGRGPEALESARRSVEADPLTLDGRRTLADILFSMERYQDSIDETLKLQQMNPADGWIYYNLGYCYAMLGRMDEAIANFEEAKRVDGEDPYNTMGLSWAHAKAGHRSEALALFEEIADNPAILREKAIILGILGDLDEAFELLDRAVAESPGTVAIIAGDASVPEAMKNDPRFAELVAKFGL